MRKWLEKINAERQLKKVNKKQINLFTVYHKPAALLKSNCVTPIHAGREIALTKSKDGYISAQDLKWLKHNMPGDDTGINISFKNRHYNEITVTYWIWKNCQSPVVGLMHYRRIFDLRNSQDSKQSSDLLKNYHINEKNISNILKEYDIILPQKLDFGKETIYQQYEKYHHIEDLELAINIVQEKYPQMYYYAENLKVNTRGWFFNMLITGKEIFDDYAEFLFDVLFELSRKLPPREDRSIYQQRIEAFIAERLSTIYFNYMIGEKGLKVKEVPVIHKEIPLPKSKIFMGKINAVNKNNKGITLLFRIKF